MSRAEVMKSYLPQVFTRTKTLKNIIETEGLEFDALQASRQDLLNQFFVETATWGLDAWDWFVGTDTKLHTIDERRKIITAKLMIQPPFGRKELLNVLGYLTDGAEISKYPQENTFDVILKTKTSFKGAYLTEVIKYVETMRPAHLDYRILIDYLHNLSIKILCSEFPSEVLTKCGTLLCEGVLWNATNGRSIKEMFQLSLRSWPSETLLRSAPDQLAKNDQGRSFHNLLTLRKYGWQSSLLSVAKESLMPVWTSGLSYKFLLQQSLKTWLGEVLPRSSLTAQLIVTDIGRSYGAKIATISYDWQSSLIPLAEGSDGRVWSDRLSQSTMAFYSTSFLRCGNAAAGEGVKA